GPTPTATSARCSPVVQELTATPCSAPTSAANAFSNSATRGPWATQPDRTASAAARASSSPRSGSMTGIFMLTAAPPGAPQHSSQVALLHAPPVDQPGEALPHRDLGPEADPLGGCAGVGQPPRDGVDLAGRTVLRRQVGLHHLKQLPGEVQQAGLLAGGDVEHVVGDVCLGGQDVG